MTVLGTLAVRVAAVLVAALLAHRLLHRQSAALRHAVLASGLAAALAVLPLGLIVPSWHVGLPADLRAMPSAPITDGGTPVAPPATPVPAPVAAPLREDLPNASWTTWLAALWATGSLVSALGLLGGLVRVRRLARRAVPAEAPWPQLAAEAAAQAGLRRPVRLLVGGSPHVLATWGVVRPRVLLPAHAAGWPAGRARVVLCHELAHIRRGDWLVQMMAEGLRAAFWFNPLTWMVCARLRRDSEQACDDVVLGSGVPAGAYAAHLLDIARSCRAPRMWAAVTPMARPSTLERRIVAMLNTDLNRQALRPRMLGIAAAALLALALPIAALDASPQAGPATLSGVVYDSTGGVLPQVALTLEDPQEVKWTATTDATGRFEFTAVAPGRHRLQASLPGFKTLQHEFTLASPRDWTQAFTLQVGTLQETISVREKRPTAAARPAADASAPVRVGGNIKPPRKLKDRKPVYPTSMRDAGLEGIVPIDALIGKDGTVVSVRVVSAQVHPEFAIAAIDAVRQWIFSPTLLNGDAIEVWMTVSVRFSLED